MPDHQPRTTPSPSAFPASDPRLASETIASPPPSPDARESHADSRDSQHPTPAVRKRASASANPVYQLLKSPTALQISPELMEILGRKSAAPVEKRIFKFGGHPTFHIRLLEDAFLACWRNSNHSKDAAYGN